MKLYKFILFSVVFSAIVLATSCATNSSVPKASSASTTNSALSDKNATENAKKLYKYLQSNYGKKVITGQMENAWDDSYNQLQQVYDKTGKYPALMGFDFMNYTSVNWAASKTQTERAIKFWNGQDYKGNKISDKHGIVAFMWHWRDPMASSSKTGSFRPGNGSKDSSGNETTTFRIPYDTDTHSWNTNSRQYKEILKDFDVIANELLKLQNAGVPVLWRPMHEAAGNLGGGWSGASAWFWWGYGNSDSNYTNVDICGECYVELWKLMYTYFTETKGIHNLIWVWNGQNAKFYPGAEYVDIIGDDIYAQNHNSQKAEFVKYQNMDQTKIVALTECGRIPSMDNISKDSAWWSYFMVWNDGNKSENSANFWNGQTVNPDNIKKEIYSSDIAITLDELPDLTK